MTLNAWLDNRQRCSHTSDTSRDIHSYLMISASFNSIALTRLIRQQVVLVTRYKMEKRNLEQCCAIKFFCVKLNENATETYEKLKRAYGQHAVSRTQVFKWHKAFLDGRDSVQDEPRSLETCTSKTNENVQQPP